MATNLVYKEAYQLSVVCSHPTTPTSGAPVRFGKLTGVALTDEAEGSNATGYTSVDFAHRVWGMTVDDNEGTGIAVGDAIYYHDTGTGTGSVNLNNSSTGADAFFGFAMEVVSANATTLIQVLHVAYGLITSLAGTAGTSQIANDAVTAAKLTDTLATGFIPLDIASLRIIGSNVIGNTTEGMLLDGNTAPSLQRVNSATDKALRVIWAASSSIECQFPPVPKPPDMDGTAVLEVHLMIGKDTNTDDTVTIDVQVFDGVGDTEAGNATAAIATATLTEYSASIAAADLAEHPGFLNISLVPGAHTTDAIWLYAAWIEYTRK